MFSFIKNIGTTELIIILVILILLFGSRFMISLGKTSGETIRELKKVKKEFTKAIDGDDSEPGKD